MMSQQMGAHSTDPSQGYNPMYQGPPSGSFAAPPMGGSNMPPDPQMQQSMYFNRLMIMIS